MKIIDLTHTLTPSIPTWDGNCGFHLKTNHDYIEDQEQITFKVQSMSLNCGIGTHVDAPAHCFSSLQSIEQLPLESLINPGILIDISHRSDANNFLHSDDIFNFESIYGQIPENSCVLIHTGWEQHWPTPKYHNNYQFPYISAEAATLLVTRNIKALGIDTLSPDRPDSGFPVHGLLLSKQILIIENIANLNLLPPTNFMVTIAPLKIKDATESPVRMWATL